MTEPDTTAIRALADRMGGAVSITTDTAYALCDGYDEAQRLRYVEADLANAREAGAAYKRQRDAARQALTAARQALADLIGELRALCDAHAAAQAKSVARGQNAVIRTATVRAVIDRHDPETP